jgi:acyl-CoA thioesterase
MNAKGIVMGGAIFTLADFTFAVATNQHEEYYTVSTTANISFMRPGMGNVLYAEAIKLRDGKTMCFYDVNVYNDNNTLIAKVNVCGTHVAK